jgi:hypothetical protein
VIDVKLSPRYTENQWNAAFDGREDWARAINIVEDRIKGRWLDAADRLIDEPHAGFAILALDCIVLESLWGFMNGRAVPRRGEQRVYRGVLMSPGFGWTEAQSDSFRELVRNGIIHDAETRSRWLVERTVPRNIVPQLNKQGDYVLNRTRFHGALKAEFEEWIIRLRAGDVALRDRMRQRMDQIIAKHYAR